MREPAREQGIPEKGAATAERLSRSMLVMEGMRDRIKVRGTRAE